MFYIWIFSTFIYLKKSFVKIETFEEYIGDTSRNIILIFFVGVYFKRCFKVLEN